MAGINNLDGHGRPRLRRPFRAGAHPAKVGPWQGRAGLYWAGWSSWMRVPASGAACYPDLRISALAEVA